jgi:hypothetical protein
MQSMLWLEEADRAFACRSEEGREKIGHVVTSILSSVVCTVQKESPNNLAPRSVMKQALRPGIVKSP